MARGMVSEPPIYETWRDPDGTWNAHLLSGHAITFVPKDPRLKAYKPAGDVYANLPWENLELEAIARKEVEDAEDHLIIRDVTHASLCTAFWESVSPTG